MTCVRNTVSARWGSGRMSATSFLNWARSWPHSTAVTRWSRTWARASSSITPARVKAPSRLLGKHVETGPGEESLGAQVCDRGVDEGQGGLGRWGLAVPGGVVDHGRLRLAAGYALASVAFGQPGVPGVEGVEAQPDALGHHVLLPFRPGQVARREGGRRPVGVVVLALEAVPTPLTGLVHPAAVQLLAP